MLAGAASSLSNDLGKMMEFTECSLADAVQMASTNPARMLHLDDRGELIKGKRADVILFKIQDNKIKIKKTILGGEEVYSSPEIR